MMNANRFFIVMISVFVSINSCKNVVCPEYDPSLSDREVIPFRLNDTIYYSSGMNDTLMFVIVDFNVEDLVITEDKEQRCFYPLSYTTNEIDGISISEESAFWTVSFGKDKVYDCPWWTGIVKNDCKSQYTDDKEFNGVIYSFVREVEDLSDNRRIDRYVKVANHGIIEFHDKQTDLTWTQIISGTE